jgi:hypothetical protein
MRFWLIAALLSTLFAGDGAMAQTSGMATPTPTIGATSPFGTGSTVAPTGIPLGSTEIASPGISPAPSGVTGTIAMPGSGTTCSTLGTAPSSMFGSSTSFDGGGMAVGSMSPAPAGTSMSSGMSTTPGTLDTSGISGMCGSGSGSVASSSTPTSTSPGSVARTGVPLGSTEMNSLGVSSAAAVPTMPVSPVVAPPSAVAPSVPIVTSTPTTSSTTTTNLFPCLTATRSAASGC